MFKKLSQKKLNLILIVFFIAFMTTELKTAHAQARSEGAIDISPFVRKFHEAQRNGDMAGSLKVFDDALALIAQHQGADHPNYADMLTSKGVLLSNSDLRKAQNVYKQALRIYEKSIGINSPRPVTAMQGLAETLHIEGRYTEALALKRKCLKLMQGSSNPGHYRTGVAAAELAATESALRHYEAAEGHFKIALDILSSQYSAMGNDPSAGPNMARTALLTVLFNRARNLIFLKKYSQAQVVLERLIQIIENYCGKDCNVLAFPLSFMGQAKFNAGLYADADLYFERALTSFRKERMLTLESTYAELLATAGLNARKLGRAEKSLLLLTEAFAEWNRKDYLTDYRRGQLELTDTHRFDYIHDYLSVSFELAGRSSRNMDAIADGPFLEAQAVQNSPSSRALASFAERAALGSDKFAHLIRERQDLTVKSIRVNRELTASISSMSRGSGQSFVNMQTSLERYQKRIREIDQITSKNYQNFALTQNRSEISFAEASVSLRENEILVFFFETTSRDRSDSALYAWVLTNSARHWFKVDLKGATIRETVSILRCGLDYPGAWRGSFCKQKLGEKAASSAARGESPAFDVQKAYDLYKALFGKFEHLIKGKKLIVVANGALTALPLHALITQQPTQPDPSNDSIDYKKMSWLINSNTITILPSLSSIKLLRRVTLDNKTTKPYLAFGNPLFSGPSGADRSAWQHQNCDSVKLQRTDLLNIAFVSRSPSPRGFKPVVNIDSDFVRKQVPLPETAEELCAIAHMSRADPVDIYLGERATETELKKLSANGELAKARILHFATHGLIADETKTLKSTALEPALLMTPPVKQIGDNDGLLLASEVAELKMNADLVILSACNTAAGEAQGDAEALSGLAKAFFYAGARSILVSHWYVNSSAAVQITTQAFKELDTHRNMGRADAFRRAMQMLIARGGKWAHPSIWAPFVLVGEGSYDSVSNPN